MPRAIARSFASVLYFGSCKPRVQKTIVRSVDCRRSRKLTWSFSRRNSRMAFLRRGPGRGASPGHAGWKSANRRSLRCTRPMPSRLSGQESEERDPTRIAFPPRQKSEPPLGPRTESIFLPGSRYRERKERNKQFTD